VARCRQLSAGDKMVRAGSAGERSWRQVWPQVALWLSQPSSPSHGSGSSEWSGEDRPFSRSSISESGLPRRRRAPQESQELALPSPARGSVPRSTGRPIRKTIQSSPALRVESADVPRARRCGDESQHPAQSLTEFDDERPRIFQTKEEARRCHRSGATGNAADDGLGCGRYSRTRFE